MARTPAGTGGQASLGNLRLLARMGPALAIPLIVGGLVTKNWWMVMAGIGILLMAQAERQGLLVESDKDSVLVKDVMLTEYSILSASATLEDALLQARHTLQDVFPVVRGGNMVGAVARQNIVEALEAGGNAYVQGIMTKTFQTAAPGDSLMATLNRVTGQVGASSQLVPVLEGDDIVGIITPQNLQRSMGLITRSMVRDERRAAEDEFEVMSLTIKGLRTGLLVAAVVLVGVIAWYVGYARRRATDWMKGLPGKYGVEISNEGVSFSHTFGANTQFKLHAAKEVEARDGQISLHDVGIVLYGAKQDRAGPHPWQSVQLRFEGPGAERGGRGVHRPGCAGFRCGSWRLRARGEEGRGRRRQDDPRKDERGDLPRKRGFRHDGCTGGVHGDAGCPGLRWGLRITRRPG